LGENIFSVCSIYGPNSNEKKFFNDLSIFLDRLEDIPVVVGGGLERHLFSITCRA
jgi:hypothetical protein